MNYRKLGKTGFEVSEISLGTWQVGGKWGSGFDDKNADTIINEAIDQGINFIDTADVYEDRQSEAAVGRVVRSRKEKVYVATKCGRFISPHVNDGYKPKVLRNYVEKSLKNTGLDQLDLVQLHCPPTEVYYRPEIFGEFEKLKDEGKIANLGVSVEKVEEALKAIEYPNVTTVQIIFNMIRHRPSELFFKEAKQKNVGIIARVPLASGLLTGKFNAETTFDEGDHRNFNREGEAFDKGETFSGLDYDLGLKAVEQIQSIFPNEFDLVNVAIRWVLMFEQVSCIIPGVSKIEQLNSNLKSLNIRNLSQEEMNAVYDVYNDLVRPSVHQLW